MGGLKFTSDSLSPNCVLSFGITCFCLTVSTVFGLGLHQRCSYWISSCNTTYTSCTYPVSGSTRLCLCNSDSFQYNNISCESLSELRAKDFHLISANFTNIAFNFLASKYGKNVSYRIQSNPTGGIAQITSSTFVNPVVAVVSNLTPGTQYTFNITSVLASDQYYMQKSTSSQSPAMRTESGLKDMCNQGYCKIANTRCITSVSYGPRCLCDTDFYQAPDNTCHRKLALKSTCNVQIQPEDICKENNTRCIDAVSGQAHCLCDTEFYENTQLTCRSLQDLQVSNIEVTSQDTTTISLKWSAGRYVANIYYNIRSNPAGGQVNGTIFTEAVVSRLTPGTLYRFTITTVLPGNQYYHEKFVEVTSAEIWTSSSSDSSALALGLGIGLGLAAVAIATVSVVVGVVCYKRRPVNMSDNRPPEYREPRNIDRANRGEGQVEPQRYTGFKSQASAGETRPSSGPNHSSSAPSDAVKAGTKYSSPKHLNAAYSEASPATGLEDVDPHLYDEIDESFIMANREQKLRSHGENRKTPSAPSQTTSTESKPPVAEKPSRWYQNVSILQSSPGTNNNK